MLALSPKSMHPIATLIIMLLAYVQGIRNTVSAISTRGEEEGGENGASKSNSLFQTTTYESSSLSNANDAFASSSHRFNEKPFRPSQIIDFTPADATTPQRHPPSYLALSYSGDFAHSQTAETRQDVEKQQQFAFPNAEKREETPTAFAAYHSSNYQNGATQWEAVRKGAVEATVPAQLQTTPIHTYRDPYTNENYHYTPNVATQYQQRPQYQRQPHYQQQYQQQREQEPHLVTAAPQEYTVQSSLLVGSDASGSGAHNFGAVSPTYNAHEQKRPGYVFEESSLRPTYAHKYAPQYAQHPNALPSFNRAPSYPKPLVSHLANAPTADWQGTGPTHLSYDSHDYPSQSYSQQQHLQQQQAQQQQHFNFNSPQRQDTASISSPNYANNFGNYLTGEGQQFIGGAGHNNPTRPIFSSNSPNRPPSRPIYNNYYDYQLGEVPPQRPFPPYHNLNYRPPPYQTQPAPSAPSGLATLASIFTTTQQYAPQFTNLLLGTLTGGGSSSGGAIPSSSSILTSSSSFTRPPSMQLIKALENIARNDDLQCVPKVLCQMIARQTQRGQLPGIITSPAITNFLSGFPAFSPALIYGRAALLGISGGESSCTQTYAKCPKNEYEIIYYLNNHRGGFFKFFSEPEEKPQKPTKQQANDDDDDGSVGASIFSILSALTGNEVSAATPTTTIRPRPKPTPAASTGSLDIASGIGNFFTQVLSDYVSGVEYQRRRRRRKREVIENNTENNDDEKEMVVEAKPETAVALYEEDFQDEEDEEDTQKGDQHVTGDGQYIDVEGRVLYKDLNNNNGGLRLKFFPESKEQREEQTDYEYLEHIIKEYNKQDASRKLKFPTAEKIDIYRDIPAAETANGESDQRPKGLRIRFENKPEPNRNEQNKINFIDNNSDYPKYTRNGRKMIFKDTIQHQFNSIYSPDSNTPDTKHSSTVIFPDHYETHIRKGRILNRPTYAASYADYAGNNDQYEDRFVLSNTQRPYNLYNAVLYNQVQQSSYTTTNSHTFNNNAGTAQGNRYTASSLYNSKRPQYEQHYNYPNANYVSSNRYSSNYQLTRGTTAAPTKHEDNKNIYITNSKGVTEYYLTPDGRKIYLP